MFFKSPTQRIIIMSASIDKSVVARWHYQGDKFEILVDPDKALLFKKGGKIDLNDVLAMPTVYHDVRNTKKVAEQDLQRIFGTVDVFKIADKIIRQGELQLTTEQRRVMVEQRRMQVADVIAKRGINPQNNLPHPTQRIVNAMDQCGVNVDPFVDAELQVDKIVKEIKKVLPIAFQKLVVELKIPSQFAGKAYAILKSSGELTKENWLGDGSLQVNMKILAGIQADFFQKVSNLTHGQFESKIVSRESI